VENDEYESLLAAFPDWETREVGKATSPKPILKKVKRFVNREERPEKVYFLDPKKSSFKWGMAVAPSTAALALLRPPDAPENK